MYAQSFTHCKKGKANMNKCAMLTVYMIRFTGACNALYVRKYMQDMRCAVLVCKDGNRYAEIHLEQNLSTNQHLWKWSWAIVRIKSNL